MISGLLRPLIQQSRLSLAIASLAAAWVLCPSTKATVTVAAYSLSSAVVYVEVCLTATALVLAILVLLYM